LSDSADAVVCHEGHRFACNWIGIVDFTALAPEIATNASAVTGASEVAMLQFRRSAGSRRWRRLALFALSTGYAGFLLLLAPFGTIIGRFYQPFRRQNSLSSGHRSA